MSAECPDSAPYTRAVSLTSSSISPGTALRRISFAFLSAGMGLNPAISWAQSDKFRADKSPEGQISPGPVHTPFLARPLPVAENGGLSAVLAPDDRFQPLSAPVAHRK